MLEEDNEKNGENQNQDSDLDPVEKLIKNLQRVVLKVDLDLQPFSITLCDDSLEEVSEVSLCLGKLRFILDDIYSSKHLFEFMGVKVASKRSSRVIKSIIEVSLLNFNNKEIHNFFKEVGRS